MAYRLIPVCLALFSSLATATPIPAAEPQFSLGGSTQGDIANGNCNKLATLIFARGTTETGNMGSTVGPSLATALKNKLGAGNVAVQGVNYPADFAGAVTGSTNPKGAAGAKDMANQVKAAIQNCPQTKLVLAGYSQGAQQVHGALMNLSPAEVEKIAAVVTFGDPLSRTAFKNIDSGKTKVFCNAGDSVCNNAFVITPAHLSYPQTAVPDASTFVAGKLA